MTRVGSVELGVNRWQRGIRRKDCTRWAREVAINPAPTNHRADRWSSELELRGTGRVRCPGGPGLVSIR